MALGWLGWSEAQTLHSDVNAILVGWEGLMERLKAEHGSTDDNSTPEWMKAMRAKQAAKPRTFYGGGGKPIVLTPDAFDAIFSNQGKTRVIRSPLKRK